LAAIKTKDGAGTHHQYNICFHLKAINIIYVLNVDKL